MTALLPTITTSSSNSSVRMALRLRRGSGGVGCGQGDGAWTPRRSTRLAVRGRENHDDSSAATKAARMFFCVLHLLQKATKRCRCKGSKTAYTICVRAIGMRRASNREAASSTHSVQNGEMGFSTRSELLRYKHGVHSYLGAERLLEDSERDKSMQLLD
jgi:hypothetical protein